VTDSESGSGVLFGDHPETGEAETYLSGGDRLAILAPHGGDIESQTDVIAVSVDELLRDRGFEPTTWCYHGYGDDAFSEYHVPSCWITPNRFEQFGAVTESAYEYAVTVHVQHASHIGLGGQIDRDVRAHVRDVLRTVLIDPPEIRIEHDAMKNEGVSSANVVNRVTADGASGLQVELTPSIAQRQWQQVVRGLAAVCEDVFVA